jgi:hypothetical protein
MKNAIVTFVVAASFAPTLCMAELKPEPIAFTSAEKRIDFLIKQNQTLIDENIALKGDCDKPKSKEEAFASCMQATKGGTSAMAAESIGIHCDQLLKR